MVYCNVTHTLSFFPLKKGKVYTGIIREKCLAKLLNISDGFKLYIQQISNYSTSSRILKLTQITISLCFPARTKYSGEKLQMLIVLTPTLFKNISSKFLVYSIWLFIVSIEFKGDFCSNLTFSFQGIFSIINALRRIIDHQSCPVPFFPSCCRTCHSSKFGVWRKKACCNLWASLISIQMLENCNCGRR